VLSVTIFRCVTKEMLITCCYIKSIFYLGCSKIIKINNICCQLVKYYLLFVLFAHESFFNFVLLGSGITGI
jgi:hypothetical protein